MINTREEFYRLRDKRTVEYGVRDSFDTPVAVAIGERAASTPSGQLALLALVNQLARIHRHIPLAVPRAPLLKATLVPASNLQEAAVRLATAIDPFIELPDARVVCPEDCLLIRVESKAPWFLGASGAVARLSSRPVSFEGEGFCLGACLASCLGGSAALRQVVGRHVVETAISAWDLSEGPDASLGPIVQGPVDVGSVLQVGAGGVGLCLDYWLWEIGVKGRWVIMDKDTAELHNSNRALALLARDAGWPNTEPQFKARVAAKLLGAEPITAWHDEWRETFTPDLVLPLANARNVRYALSMRGEPMLLHATTSRDWEAQVHRHIPDRDDCINCRIPVDVAAQFRCAEATIVEQASGESSDAALPFLSAAAGLTLVANLLRLQFGAIADVDENFWSINFNTARRYGQTARWRCPSDCRTRLDPQTRLRIHGKTRWSKIDSASHTP